MNSRRPRSLADYSRAARRHKLILIVPALVLAIASAITLRDLPNLYELTARMRFTSVKTGGAYDLSVHLHEFREHLTSRDTLAMLISKNDQSAESSESVISQMCGRIAVEPDVSPEAQPGAFTLSYRATDPETARRTTDEMADRLVTLSSKEPSSALSEAEIVRKRAADIAIQLSELEHKDPWLTGVRSDVSVTTSSLSSRSSQPSPEALRAQQMTIDSLKDQQYKIHQQLADVDRRITAQRQIVEQQKKGSTLRDNPTYAVLITKRTELQGQRDTLISRQELTELTGGAQVKYPDGASVADSIEKLRYDLYYIKNQSLLLDAIIVFETIKIVMFGRGGR